MAVTPAQLVTALQDWGVTVKAYEPDGKPWHSHTTPGGWSPVGVMHHHTAGSSKLLTDAATVEAMLRLLRVGRTDAPGPLCHLAPAMIPGTGDARVWLLGWGNVNHGGMGSSRTLNAVKGGKYAGAAPGADDVDTNPWYWGLEYLHPGTSLAWPAALLEAGHRAACAICEAQGWSAPSWPGSNVEHRESTTRKIDRSWSGDLRKAIRDTIEEGKMPTVDLTPAAVKAIAEALAKYRVPNLDPATGQPIEGSGIAIGTAISQLERWEDQERGVATQVLAAVKALAAALAQLTQVVGEVQGQVTAVTNVLDAIVSDPGGLDGEQLAAVAEQVVTRVVDRLADALTQPTT